MPSETVNIRWDGDRQDENRWRRLPKVVLAVLVLLFVSTVLAVFAGYGIKFYVVTTNSFAAFEACGVQYVWDIFSFCVIGFSVMFGCDAIGGLLTLCTGTDDEPEDEYNRELSKPELLATIGALGVLTYSFIAFGTNMVVWVGTDAPEEALLFYPEFYEDDFSNCASGQDLVNVKLAVTLYKIESFIVMMLILLACPCCVLYAFLCSE